MRLLLANGKPLKGPRLYFVWMEAGFGIFFEKSLFHTSIDELQMVWRTLYQLVMRGFCPPRVRTRSQVHEARSLEWLRLSMATCKPRLQQHKFKNTPGQSVLKGMGDPCTLYLMVWSAVRGSILDGKKNVYKNE